MRAAVRNLGSMRILMINKYAHVTGGADVNVLGLADLLCERRHEVAFLSTNSPQNATSHGVFIEPPVTHESRDQLGVGQQVEVAWRALWNPSAAAAMRRLVAEFRPQVVHAHKLFPQLSIAPVVAAARAGVPVVQTLHDYELLSASQIDHRGKWIDRDESKLSYRMLNTATFPLRHWAYAPRVRAFIACSRYLAARYATRGVRSTVLPYFVPPSQRTDLPDFASRGGAVFVGRLHEEKGVTDIVKLAEAAPWLEVKVAGYGPLSQVVELAAAQLSNLEFAGRVDRDGVLSFVKTARIFLMPSRWQEPGGIAALEAMSVGTPVLAYANGGLAEYVGDAGGGVVVEPDPAALARACADLHDDSATWTELSERGLAAVANAHSPEAYVRKVESIYRRLL
jgi:glycosyltransferase involved in cell wall biosynthesis